MISHEIKPYDDRSYVVTSYHRFVYDIISYYTTSIEPVCCARKAATVQTSKLDRRPKENNLINFSCYLKAQAVEILSTGSKIDAEIIPKCVEVAPKLFINH